MKKNLFNSALLAMAALMGGILISCGGSGGSSEASDLPTDGPFGAEPKAYLEMKLGTKEIEAQMAQVKNQEEMQALFQKAAALTKHWEEVRDAEKIRLEGQEIKTEVADDLPFKLTTPFKHSGSNKISLEGETTGEVQYINDDYGTWFIANMRAIVYDKDGNSVAAEVIRSTYLDIESSKAPKVFPAGTKIKLFANTHVNEWTAPGYANAEKIVIVRLDSEEAKQAKAAEEEAKKAYKLKVLEK